MVPSPCFIHFTIHLFSEIIVYLLSIFFHEGIVNLKETKLLVILLSKKNEFIQE